MAVTKNAFEEGASLYTLENANGMQAVITDFGGVLQSLRVPDRNGSLVDVVLGYDKLEDYKKNPEYHGQLVGRFANRIGGDTITINGKVCTLEKNEGPNVLHGGPNPYGHRMWEAKVEDDALVLTLDSPDGDQGMPGNAKITVRYTLTDDNALHIAYHAVADQDTCFNLTNHAYFNLSGHDSGDILDQYVEMDCSRITAIDGAFIPNGEIPSVLGTPMDFTKEKTFGADIDKLDCEQLRLGNGYDHNYVLDAPGLDHSFVRCRSEQTGIVMEGFTDLPGVQFYSGNNMGTYPKGKNGAAYTLRNGFCLETQYFPDTPNKANFPSCIFKAGEPFVSETIYKFSIK